MTEQTRNLREQRLTLNPHLRVIHTGDDEVLIKHGGRSLFSRVVQDTGRTKLLGRVLRALATPATLNELIARGVVAESESTDALDLIGYLQGEQVLMDPEADLTRVYLDSVLGGSSDLSAMTVGIVGSGYLGSRIIDRLTDFGFKALLACDGRAVENEKVERRYFNLMPGAVEQGKPYTECVRRHLEAKEHKGFTPLAGDFTDEGRLAELVAGSDFVVAALELLSPGVLHTINKLALEAGKPWMILYLDGSEAFIGPIFKPLETCCYSEFEIQHEAASVGRKDEYLVYKESLADGLNTMHLVLPPYLDTASGMGVTGLLHFLLSGKSFLIGRSVRFDFERLSVDYEEVFRLPRCPACSPYRPYRHLFL